MSELTEEESTNQFVEEGSASKFAKKAKVRKDQLPVVGISIGDVNGIGPEVTIKALSDKRMLGMMTPVVFASAKVLSYYRKQCNLERFNFMTVKETDPFAYGKVNVVNCWDQPVPLEPGKVTPEGGQAAWLSLKKATEQLKVGAVDALVTAPINKHNIQNEEFTYAGHTEFLAKTFEVDDNLMLLVHDALRVGVVTGHIPLQQVSVQLTREKVRRKLQLMEQSLRQDFGIVKPRIAVMGLNPHAGEDGLLGTEEKDIIQPVISELKQKGSLVFGPYPSDGFFGAFLHQKFDGIMAMYHDQGLIPFKTLAFEAGVNFTAGLSVVRTSPDHGTAYDIAGQDRANPTSMREAIYLACDILKNRRLNVRDES